MIFEAWEVCEAHTINIGFEEQRAQHRLDQISIAQCANCKGSSLLAFGISFHLRLECTIHLFYKPLTFYNEGLMLCAVCSGYAPPTHLLYHPLWYSFSSIAFHLSSV